MENDPKRPALIIAVGTLILLVGGFLFFVYVGTNGRRSQSFASRINFHSFSSRVSAYYGGLKHGGASLKAKADNFMNSFWEEPGDTASAARRAEAAKRGGADDDWTSGGGDGEEGDSYGKYYNKNYGGGSGSGMDPGSWVDNSDGGPSFGGGSSSGGSSAQYAASPKGAPRGKPQAAAPAPGFSPAAGNSASRLRPGFGSPSMDGPKAAAQRLYASSAKAGTQGPALQYGGGMPAYGNKANNRLNGMSGNQAKGAGELDSATENMRGGAQSSYNSKLSGGASAISGGSSGGSIPAASGPANISGGGSAGGGAGSAAAANNAKATATGPGSASSLDDAALYDAPEEDADLLKSVVSETQTGREAKYLSVEDANAAPDETMLKSGAIAATDSKDTKDAKTVTPDPENLNELSAERKMALKKNIHVFLKRIQNRFGMLANIKTTSCTSTLDLCAEHGVTGNYLTMTTQKGAKLDLGVKYIKTKWRRYTIDFQKPDGTYLGH